MSNIYMQYGAGFCGSEKWINFDASPSLRLQRIPLVGRILGRSGPSFPSTVSYGDITKGLTITENTLKAIYCSHVLEHLSLEDFRIALLNTFRYLQLEGRFRFVLPDLELIAKRYINSQEQTASIQFLEETQGNRMSKPSKTLAVRAANRVNA